MRINWTVRFRNKVWLAEFLAFIVSTVFHLLSQFDIAPVITESAVMQNIVLTKNAAHVATGEEYCAGSA